MAAQSEELIEIAHQTPTDRRLRIPRPAEIMREIESIPGVTAVSSSVVGSGVLTFGVKQLPIEFRGIEFARQNKVTPLDPYITEGSARALDTSPDGVLLGSDAAAELGAHVGDHVVCNSPVGKPINLKVIGLFSSGIQGIDISRMYTNINNAQALLGRPNVFSRMEVRLSDPHKAPAAASFIEKKFGYDAESWQEANASSLALFEQQDAISGIIISAILAIGGFGILSIQIMIVLQKTRDIALMRSVGFRRADILAVFLLQGAIIALIGAFLGDLLGHGLIAFLSGLKVKTNTMVKSDTFLVRDDPMFYFYGAAFALITGLLASFLPSYRGSKIEPVDVLRGQIQ